MILRVPNATEKYRYHSGSIVHPNCGVSVIYCNGARSCYVVRELGICCNAPIQPRRGGSTGAHLPVFFCFHRQPYSVQAICVFNDQKWSVGGMGRDPKGSPRSMECNRCCRCRHRRFAMAWLCGTPTSRRMDAHWRDRRTILGSFRDLTVAHNAVRPAESLVLETKMSWLPAWANQRGANQRGRSPGRLRQWEN